VTTELSVAAERTVTVAVAAVAVLAALLARMAVLVAATNRRAIELIAQGRGDLPVAAVARARQRLLDPAQRESLARALDVIRAEASRPPSECHRIAPLYRVPVVRAVSPELGEVARLVRGNVRESRRRWRRGMGIAPHSRPCRAVVALGGVHREPR
jgi:hypothetical protein